MRLLQVILLIFFVTMCTPRDGNVQKEQGVIPAKVDSLLALMTLEEKIGQLNMYNGTWEFTGPVPQDGNSQEKAKNIASGRVGGMLNVLTAKGTREAQKLAVENSRLGIPLIFGYDVIHGYQTMLPVPIAQAASWDYEAARLGSEIAAREAAASGIHWTFAPMIDVSRDARWGRIMESAGEDPYLSSVMAKAWVEGYQGDELSDLFTIAACAKHFAAYGLAKGGRDYNTVDISPATLYNVVLPPFKAASDAGVATLMNSFNELNGVPANGSALLQREILKEGWGFKGFVVSDWGSIGEMITHGFAYDSTDAALKAIVAGSDMDMESRIYEKALEDLVNQRIVSGALIDDAVKRILTIKYELGLFDDPYRYSSEEREKTEVGSKENLEGVREVARRSLVLLKNENDLLPLEKNVSSIAVIGQLASSKDVPLGNWRAQAVANSAISLLEGIQNAVSASTTVRFAQGYTLVSGQRDFVHKLNVLKGDRSGFKKAINLARQSDVVVLALGEDCYQTGEGRSQADISLKSNQEELLTELLKVNKKVVVVLMNGRPLAIPEVIQNTPSVLETWFAGSEAGNAIADVLFGDYNPSGKLPVSFPYHVGQEPLHYDRKNTGRPVPNGFDSGLVFWSHYTDIPNEAVLPFGHGLSYTSFEYSDLKISKKGDGVEVSALLTNTGNRKGTEVAQLYMRDMVASLTRPIRQLKGFQKVSLDVGQSENVNFVLTKEDLSFYSTKGDLTFEPGAFQFWVGGSSVASLTGKVDL
ncbi:beta-glucosidase BglX [Fulvivirga sp. M361]|uniref:beta-glucosidase BglX n=1 Tax=Fulvivirga sp. M361 TaxID=2594266 RepID=UPI00117AF1F8|nr:beta-glucosidase BglX [Fulvivirga sp. M361]TRX54363.1 beta-glucosidase BglX [Fulvivirga sp. M361]